MAIKRYVAEKDTVISNAYKNNLVTRATGSNMGAADILEVFSIYGQASTSSVELSRVLLQFPVAEISASISAGEIPANASYYLRLFNAPHGDTTPKSFYLNVQAVSRSWDEGRGMDLDSYLDSGYANWEIASSSSISGTSSWTTPGGDFVGTVYSSLFNEGTENLEVDISNLVKLWISGTIANNGLVVKLQNSDEVAAESFYTKKFFGRTTEYFYKKPVIEVRWDSALKDARGKFYASSSLADTENVNKLYFYNIIKGQYKDIPGSVTPYVRIFDSESGGSEITTASISSSRERVGIYYSNITVDTTASVVYDRWYSSSATSSTCYYTGTISVNQFDGYGSIETTLPTYVVSMPNLKSSYLSSENPTFRFFVRAKDWQPTIYTVISADPESEVIEDAYYRITRVADNYEVIDYGTGSIPYTRMSYDSEGNYFDLDLSFLEAGYTYRLNIAFAFGGDVREISDSFKFRVE